MIVLIVGVAVARPLVIGHRGAPAHFPDHTIAGYLWAAEHGADFIEPDLVSTKDGVLVCRHENEIGTTTDVASKFPDRKTTKTVDGEEHTGWFTEDFTLAELQTLTATQPLPFRPQTENGKHGIVTFDEVITLAKSLSSKLKRPIGVYPETKHPSYFDGIGLSLEEPLLASLDKAGWTTADAPVFIQSFEPANLRELRGKTGVRLVQLIGDPRETAVGDTLTYGEMLADPAKLTWADGLGPHKSVVDKALVERVHAADKVLHVYTFRSEAKYLPEGMTAQQELKAFYDLGVDGVFSDQPEHAFEARK